MRNWDQIIAIEGQKIDSKLREPLAEVLRRNHVVAEVLGASIDLMLNNLSVPEVRDGITYQLARTDPVMQEWEATFSTVNMLGPVIVSLACQGFYLPAICLLRQELEGIAQLKHILDRQRTTKHGPHIGHLDERMRRWYNLLTEGAHLSSDRMASMQAPLYGGAENIALLPHGSCILPQFDAELAADLIEIHIALREELTRHVEAHLQRIGLKEGGEAEVGLAESSDHDPVAGGQAAQE